MPIGVFDSGFGGLTVLKEIVKELPQYDFIYLGDNARAPYGSRSFETVYEYTLECVKELLSKGCHLVILACNTASAKALRTIQQKDLPVLAPNKRVLGVIRPTAEIVGALSKTKHVGILGTTGTVSSGSYKTEILNFFSDIHVFQEACPMWVPLIENGEFESEAASMFIEKNVKALMQQSNKIDTIILGCTHYPLIEKQIKKFIPEQVRLLSQGEIVAKSLKNYLFRHPEIDEVCSKNATITFYTTDLPESFDAQATRFYGKAIKSEHLNL
ncbi:MAG: glutamate racemase [Sphingobacteriaceae bacterium]|nr:glutamate racemase [Sphingobacteriaceae bacterium]